MATTVKDQPIRSTLLTSRWVLFGALALLVSLNATYFLLLRPPGNTVESKPALRDTRVLQAVALPSQRCVVLTSANHLVMFSTGNVLNDKAVPDSLSALTVSPDGQRIAAGTTDNQVIIWDDQLNEVTRYKVGGRVTDLRIDDGGQAAVAYGIGQYTGRFFVGRFDLSGKQLFKKQVGADVNAIEVDGQNIYYAPVNGKLLALAPDGKRRWEIPLNAAGLVIRKTAAGNLLTGDERGSVFLVNPEGRVLWSRRLSEYNIRMVAETSSDGHIVVGDDDGKLFVLNGADGMTVFQSAGNPGSARGLVSADASSLTMFTSEGHWLTLNLAGALGAQRQGTVDTIMLGIELLLGVTALSALVATVPHWRATAVHTGRRLRDSRKAYLMLLPAFSLIIIFNYIPTAMGLYYSFTNFNLAEPLKFVGFNNFVKLSRDDFFWAGIGNMILILITSVAKELIVPLIVAELVFWLRNARLKYWTRTAFIVPSIVPGLVGIMLWKTIYNAHSGLLNQLLQTAGLGYLQHAWLGDEKTALWAIIFAGFPWIGTFAFLIYMGGLLNINRELFDSAAIDGTNPWSRFWNIDMPLIRPQLRLILFFAFLGSVQGYAGVWIFTQGGPGSATYVPGLQMFLQTARGEYGYAASIGLVLAMVVLAVTVARFRFNQTPGEA
ncbi:MAG: ABC transporter permease subunit [Chloroflexi bacterium]|nr:ABC transporter permease subunit [Chloroflexota bacterium]